jgi:hypothetical protein
MPTLDRDSPIRRRAASLLFVRIEEGDSLDDGAAEAVFSDVIYHKIG